MSKKDIIKSIFHIICFIICVWLLIFSSNKIAEYDKIRYADVNGVVYDKLGQMQSPYKSSRVYTDFIFIVKDKETGNCFDVKVTPTTFSTKNIGDDVFFKHIDRNKLGANISDYSFAFVLLSSCCLIVIIIYIVLFFIFIYCLISDLFRKPNKNKYY